jgi:hypothetical protein
VSLLLLGLAIIFLALLLRPSAGDAAKPGLLLLAYLLPAAFLTWVLVVNQVEATRFRFALLGLGFRGAPGESFALSLGGDRDTADVWISALKEGKKQQIGKLTFQPAAGGQGTAHLLLEGNASAAGFLGLGKGGGRLVPLSSVLLEPGDRLTVDGQTWEARIDNGFFGSPLRLADGQSHEVALPRRESKLPLGFADLKIPVGRPQGASQETYPLAWLDQVNGDLPAKRTSAFLFRVPGPIRSGGVYLAAPDGSVRIERAGKALPILRSVGLAAGDVLHVLSYPRWDEKEFRAGGWRDRRSFKVDTGEHSATLAFETKEIYALPWRQSTPDDSRVGLEDLNLRARAPDNPEEQPLQVSLSMGGWRFADRSLHFTHASQKTAGEALAILELPRNLGRGKDTFSAATPRGQSQGTLGRPIWLGGDRLAAVQIDVLRPALALGLFALFLALLKSAVGWSVRLSPSHLLFAAAIEALVTLRLLLGFRAWAMAPFSEESFRLAMIAWALLPWGFLALAGDRGEDDFLSDRNWRNRLPILGGLFFSLAWCVSWSGASGLRLFVWVALHLLLAMMALRGELAGWTQRAHAFLGSGWQRISEWTRRIGSLLPQRFQRAWRWAFGDALPWVLWAFVPGLLRFAFFLIGAKESLPVGGQRFALTLLHIPLAILLQAGYLAWLWQRSEQTRRISLRDLMPALMFLLFTWLVPAFFVSDLGLALLNVPVFLILLAALCMAAVHRANEAGESGPRLARALALLALVGTLVFTSLPAGARVAVRVLAFLKPDAFVERNYLRVLAYAYPEELEKIARRSSEELAVMNAVMDGYTTRPFRACRYFSSEISPHLRPTALREHVTSVLLAAEWSFLGVIGVVLIFIAAMLAGWRLSPWRAEDDCSSPASLWRNPCFLRLVALLSALTFAIPSLYMILANYRLTLFTGKNVYLLGVDSTTDVLESLLLAGLFAWSLTRAQAEEAAP